MIDFDEIRKEVAVKHGVLLAKDDPVLATVTINEVVLSRYVEILNEKNAEHQEVFTAVVDAAINKSIEDSKKVANRIVNDGTKYVIDQCKAAIEESLKEVEKRIGQKTAFIVKTREEAVTAKQLALGAAGLSLFFTFVTWGAMLGKWFV